MDRDTVKPGPRTARLALEPHTLADFDESAEMWADPDAARYITGAPSTRTESWARLLRHAETLVQNAGHGEIRLYTNARMERNIALYRRYGFEVISEHKARPDAPPLWSMWREPRVVEI